jgi:hypothetical protein
VQSCRSFSKQKFLSERLPSHQTNLRLPHSHRSSDGPLSTFLIYQYHGKKCTHKALMLASACSVACATSGLHSVAAGTYTYFTHSQTNWTPTSLEGHHIAQSNVRTDLPPDSRNRARPATLRWIVSILQRPHSQGVTRRPTR